jgi:cytochrome c-type biogenesis protein CcmH
VKVALDPDFAARVRLRGDASVFVIARAVGGPPMPVAVEKHPVSALPLTVTLDDGDGPMPTAKLSALQEVEVIARISDSGNAMRQNGDIESAPQRVRLPSTAPVALTLGAP